jgi:hypothetical protein
MVFKNIIKSYNYVQKIPLQTKHKFKLLNTFSSLRLSFTNSIPQCLINPKTNIDRTQAYRRFSWYFTLGELTFVPTTLIQTKTQTPENTLICNYKKWNKTIMKFWWQNLDTSPKDAHYFNSSLPFSFQQITMTLFHSIFLYLFMISHITMFFIYEHCLDLLQVSCAEWKDWKCLAQIWNKILFCHKDKIPCF